VIISTDLDQAASDALRFLLSPLPPLPLPLYSGFTVPALAAYSLVLTDAAPSAVSLIRTDLPERGRRTRSSKLTNKKLFHFEDKTKKAFWSHCAHSCCASPSAVPMFLHELPDELVAKILPYLGVALYFAAASDALKQRAELLMLFGRCRGYSTMVSDLKKIQFPGPGQRRAARGLCQRWDGTCAARYVPRCQGLAL